MIIKQKEPYAPHALQVIQKLENAKQEEKMKEEIASGMKR